MIGYVSINLALVVSFLVTSLYFVLANDIRGDKKGLLRVAGILYYISVALIGIAACYLLYLILCNRLDYAYVSGYSSRDLPLVYKLSAFWAGQAGSNLLWLVFHATFGVALLRTPNTSAGVMAVYCLIQAVLLMILFVNSPFIMLTEPRLDGLGLNPLLQDLWMVIHPPLIFLGYAALAVPFAYAFNGIITGRHHEWVMQARIWTRVALASLGAGIFVGGLWAYKVLGWGGYWAWDPVENSSLVPWLAAGATAHMLAMVKLRAGAIRLSYIGVIVNFLLVLYGTFLTRSGILRDFSTHSFADEGNGWLLGLVVFAFTAVSFVLYIIKSPAMPSGELYPSVGSKEFFITLTALLLALFSALVLVGMSTPIVTMALASPNSVSSNFYNNVAFPLAVVMGAALALAPLLRWGGVTGNHVRKYLWLGLPAAVGFSLAVRLQILHQPLATIVICLAASAAAAQVYAAWKGMSKAIACIHLGVAVILIGIMASGAGSRSTVESFIHGQPKQVFGEQVTYIGTETEPAGKTIHNTFQVGVDNTITQTLTKFNKEGQPVAREPAIYRKLLYDLYIAHVEKKVGNDFSIITLAKGEPLTEGDVQLEFIKFNLAGMDGNDSVRVEALIKITAGTQSGEIKPELTNKDGHILSSTVKAFEQYEIRIVGIKPADGKLSIEFKDTHADMATGSEQFNAEVSRKPLINLVWLGALLIIGGTGWSGLTKLAGQNRTVEKGRHPLRVSK